MEKAGETNGVNRCVREITSALRADPLFDIHHWVFTNSCNDAIPSIKQVRYQLTYIPLPYELNEFLGDTQMRHLFWEQVYHQFKHLFATSEPVILNVHTMNLIELAMLIRKKRPGKIVTHIHCWPWKLVYNYNRGLFYQLYNSYYIEKNYSDISLYISNEYERLCYEQSDHVICVTNCMGNFIRKMYPERQIHLSIIPNGLKDNYIPKVPFRKSKMMHCLYVGSRHPAKGLSHILRALNMLKTQIPIKLTIAGNYSLQHQNSIKERFRFIDVEFLGIVPLETLHYYYTTADVGIIASIHEQCSYVAIEMMMSGIPIISTAVDGLGEMFIHGYNALLVPLKFDIGGNPRIDPFIIADYIMILFKNPALGAKLGRNARKTYEQKYQQHIMVNQLRQIYLDL